MPKIAYSEQEREQIEQALIDTGLELFVKQGIQHTTVEQIYTRVGISRTFFYSFFPAKGDLIVQAFYRQRPKIVQHARQLMANPALSWREGVKQLLYDCCHAGEKSRFVIMSVAEQQSVYKCLSQKNYQELQEKQLAFFAEVLGAFGIRAPEATTKFLWNLVFSAVIVRKAIPDTLRFFFPEAADEMTEFHIDALVDYMETLRERQDETQ